MADLTVHRVSTPSFVTHPEQWLDEGRQNSSDHGLIQQYSTSPCISAGVAFSALCKVMPNHPDGPQVPFQDCHKVKPLSPACR